MGVHKPAMSRVDRQALTTSVTVCHTGTSTVS